VIEHFPSLGLPLGVSAVIPVSDECQTLAFREGDRIYLFSDGLTEVADGEGNFFGTDQLVRSLAALSADGDLTAVLAQLAEFHGGTEFADDMTLVELRP
jgi:sigma-B regulation protein RsbU (phosphoserine phosphatase)